MKLCWIKLSLLPDLQWRWSFYRFTAASSSENNLPMHARPEMDRLLSAYEEARIVYTALIHSKSPAHKRAFAGGQRG